MRLRLADEEPIAIEASVFAPRLAAVLERRPRARLAVRHAGRRRPRPDRRARLPRRRGRDGRRRAPRSASSAGAPLLVERRLILDQSGRPLELTESRYAADRYTLEVSFDVELA